MADYANIKVPHETRDRLREAKRGGESYGEIIERLLNAETNDA